MSQHNIDILHELLEYIANPTPTNIELRSRKCIKCNRYTIFIQSNGDVIKYCACINPMESKP